MIECLIVGAGGFIGSVCRYLIGLIPLKEGTVFPVKTFIINVTGCFLIGLIAAAASRAGWINPKTELFLKTGICGGFTTFSSFALETGSLVENGNTGMALMYILFSVAAGIAAVFAGQAAVRFCV